MNGSVIGAVLFAGMTLAAAAADEVRIGISADRAECLYRVNEPVEFTVKLTKADGSPVTDGQVSVSFDNFGGHGLKSDRYAAKDRKI